MAEPRPTKEQMKQFNAGIIAEFRDNGGKVGGPFEGQTMVLLTTTGAKSGKSHTTPLVCGQDGDTRYVIASAAGAPKHPAWFHNLRANPTVKVEAGAETYDATAKPVDEPKRSELYAAMEERMPPFKDYRSRTERTIPVVLLERA
ncbi:MAG: nitroreductase family deazaflavin-dependent oxidoreductase [Myxococcales bacterium]|nr:nitroreductase family deazaflavin-dependent oxidoreductase [Myxococcales bacterium]